MIRRSFRIGLTLGLLGGLALALAKVLAARPHTAADTRLVPTEPWPPLAEHPTPVAAPRAAPTPEPTVETAAEPSPVPAATPDGPSRVRREPLRATDPVATPPASAPPATAHPAPETPVAPAEMAPAEPAAKMPAAKQAAKKATAKKPTAKKPAAKKAAATAWVEPSGDVCPTSHPVKAKLASKIFHLPGMLNYARTRPDRCYRDAVAAESDGLRPAKR